MRDMHKYPNSGRRHFFLRGGAALGAGLASAGAGAALLDDSLPLKERLAELQQQLAGLEDREVLGHLFQAYTTLVADRAWTGVAALFASVVDLDLDGTRYCGPRDALAPLFAGLCQDNDVYLHTAFRRGPVTDDAVTMDPLRQTAQASFAREVRLARPITAQNTVAAMARLQGMDTDSRWQQGQFQLQFVRESGNWRISHLRYLPT